MDNTFLTDIMKNASDQFLEKKKQLIRSTLWNQIGVELNIDDECRKRFPRLKAEIQVGGGEVWYWNNGTSEGFRLITFYQSEPIVSFKEPLEYTFKIEETYQIP